MREWEGVKGKIRVFLSREAVEKWFAELDGEPQARMATAERRRICIVWLLSLYSMIDYAELAPSLCEKVMKQGEFEDAFNEFSKNISDNVSYIRWKNCFEDFMKEWAELMKSHYLDGEIERELLEFLRKRMDFLRNMSNYYLVRDPFPEYEEWMKAQMTKSENIMTESK